MNQHRFLRLFVDPSWRRNGIHSPFMNPWWGNPYTEESIFAKEVFDSFQFDTSHYGITDHISEADMVFVPYRHQWALRHDPALLDAAAAIAEKAQLPLLIDGVGDVEYPLAIKNAYVLRIGGYRFIHEQERIEIPCVVDDLLERCAGGQLQIRKKRENERPIVGFAGWAKLTLRQAARSYLKQLSVRLHGIIDSRYRAMIKGVFWRAKAIAILQSSRKVTLNVRSRDSFSGSAKTAQGDMRQLQREFVDTILHSDYCLEIRGDPNTSNRLFEIASLGRIPVLLDTERILPFEDLIDYNDFCLIVDFRDIKRMPDIIAKFHNEISPEKFEAMQRKAREVFLRFFHMNALMPHIIYELKKRGAIK